MTTSTTGNNKTDSELANKRSLNALNLAFETSATENEALGNELLAQRANGVAVTDSAISKAFTAAKYQRQAIVDLSDSAKKALMTLFNVGDCAKATINSYSLEKLASIGAMVDAGDWTKQDDFQFAVWLAKAIDSENENDMAEWKAIFAPTTGNEKFSVLGKSINKSPTQQNQSDCLAERLGMIKRIKTGRSFTSWEKCDHKSWEKFETLFDAHLASAAQ